MHSAFSDYWHLSRAPERHSIAAWVSAIVATFAAVCGLRLWWDWPFEFSNPHEIYGLIWQIGYPKRQDTVGFVVGLASVCAGVAIARPLWVVVASALSRLWASSPDLSLTISALMVSALLLLVPYVAADSWFALHPIWLPLAVVGLLLLVSARSVEGAPPRREARRWTLPIRWIVFPALLYAIYYEEASIWRLHMDLFEEGASLAPLQAWLQGGEVYRDGYVQHGLFQNLGKPLLASYFETSLISLRNINAHFAPLGPIAVYVLGLSVLRTWWLALPLAIIFAGPLTHVSDRQSLGLISVALIAAALWREQDRRRSRSTRAFFAVSGACAVLAFFYSTEIGIYAGVTGAGFLLLKGFLDSQGGGFAPLRAWSAGAILAAAPLLLYFAWRGVFGDFLSNTYIQCAYQEDLWGLPYPSLITAAANWQGLRGFLGGTEARAYLPPLVYLVATGVVAFRIVQGGFWQRASNQVLLLVVIAAATWFRTALGRSDKSHIASGTPFFWVLLLMYGEWVVNSVASEIRSGARTRRVLRWVACAGCLVVSIWIAEASYAISDNTGRRIYRAATGTNQWPREPEAIDRFGPEKWPAVAAALAGNRDIVRKIRDLTVDGDYIYDFTNQGALYFLADRRSPTRFQQVIYAATPALRREIVADLERTKPKLVVFESRGLFSKRLASLDGVENAVRHPEIAAYLNANYRELVYTRHATFLLRTATP